MKSFKEMVAEMEMGMEDEWTREDLKNLIDEVDDEDISEVSDFILSIVAMDDDYDWDEMEDCDWEEYDYDDMEMTDMEMTEKMSAQAKKKAKKLRKKPAFKKAKKLKAMCMSRHGDKVRKSDGKLTCGSDGKLKKGMSKADRRKLKKTRKKNKKIIIK